MSKPGPNHGWGDAEPLRLMRWSLLVVVLALLALALAAVAAAL